MSVQSIITAYFNGLLSYHDAFLRLLCDHGLHETKIREYLDT